MCANNIYDDVKLGQRFDPSGGVNLADLNVLADGRITKGIYTPVGTGIDLTGRTVTAAKKNPGGGDQYWSDEDLAAFCGNAADATGCNSLTLGSRKHCDVRINYATFLIVPNKGELVISHRQRRCVLSFLFFPAFECVH